jgi:hypothetical protein
MLQTLLLFVGVVAGLLFVLLIVGCAALPQAMVRVFAPIPAKFFLLQIGLMLTCIAVILAYWSLQLPKTARVALGLLRSCLCIATASVATPFSFFGLKSLSVAVTGRANVDFVRDTSLQPVFAVGIVALIVAYCALREYHSARLYEYEHGLARDI